MAGVTLLKQLGLLEKIPLNLHVNLTEGLPLAENKWQRIPSLLNASTGRFLGKKAFVAACAAGSVCYLEAELEVR